MARRKTHRIRQRSPNVVCKAPSKYKQRILKEMDFHGKMVRNMEDLV